MLLLIPFSQMDDNKMLTLASNERIPLKGHSESLRMQTERTVDQPAPAISLPAVRMIFEIRDLVYASPATVSRAGIIYISTNTGSQWRSLIASWLKKLEVADAVRETLRDLFDRYCAPTLLFIKKECKPLVPVEDVTLVNNLLRLLRSLLTPSLIKKISDPALPPEEQTRIIDTYFVFAALWAFGSALSMKDGEDYRIRFSDFWKGEFKSVRLPTRETVFEYWLNPETLTFDQWKNSPHFSVVHYDSKTTPMGQVTVPTPETCSVVYWMEQMVAQRDPVSELDFSWLLLVLQRTRYAIIFCSACRLCGMRKDAARVRPPRAAEAGEGCFARHQLQLLHRQPRAADKHGGVTKCATCFVSNAPYYVHALRALQAPLEKKTGTNYGPPGKAALVYFLDDLNLPELDKYNTQSAIALVRQQVRFCARCIYLQSSVAHVLALTQFDYGHWYERSKFLLRNLLNCQYLACLNPTAGSFVINPRLQRHFLTLAVRRR